MNPLPPDIIKAMVDEIVPRLKRDLALAADRWRKRELVMGMMDKAVLLGAAGDDVAKFWKKAGYIVELDDDGRLLHGSLYKTDAKGNKAEEVTEEEFKELVAPLIPLILRSCFVYFDAETLEILEKGNHQYQDIWDEAREYNTQNKII